MLEVPSARSAAVHHTEKDIESLRHIIEQQKSIAYDNPELIHLDSNFHTAVAEASKNQLLASFVFAMHRVIHKKPSEKPHLRANRLTIKRMLATYMKASALSGTLS